MKKVVIIIIVIFTITSCGTDLKDDFRYTPKLANLLQNDTLFIEACIHHECGGEWGGCLEQNKIYQKGNIFSVDFITGIKVWDKDTIRDQNKMTKTSKALNELDIKSIDEFLSQVNIFSDSTGLTSNGPNYYTIKTKNYKKTIIQDYNQWLFYQRLKDNLYK